MNRMLCLRHRTLFACTALGLALILSGCPQNGDDGGNGGGDGATTVDVSLREFSVTPEAGSAPEGSITFRVTNNGSAAHEFMVILADLAPNALPTEANGAYEEDGDGTEVVDEIEQINPGQTANLTVNLEAGNYVLICNMVNQGFVHYALGMRTAFTVTGSGQ